MRILFVDGYNVLNSWPNLKEDKNSNFDGARNKLIDIMHNYGSYSNSKIILVFDGYKVSGNLENKENINQNLSIVFTKGGETADSYIEHQVHRLGRRYDICVVTSDWLEQQTIFQRGAVRMSSIEFHNEVSDIEHSIRNKTEKNKNISRNPLEDNVDLEVLRKLEEIRRSH